MTTLDFTPDNIRRAIDINFATMDRMGREYGPAFAWMASKDHNCILAPNSKRRASLGRKWDDVIAAGFTQSLAFCDRHGDDAVRVLAGNRLEMTELKLGMYSKTAFTASNTGSIVSKTPFFDKKTKKYKHKTFHSTANTHYEIVNNAESKRRDTIFTVLDDDDFLCVDQYLMDGDTAYNLLTNYDSSDPRFGKKKNSRKRTISLAKYLEKGVLHRPEGVHVIGLGEWEQDIRFMATDHTPVVYAGCTFPNERTAHSFYERIGALHLMQQMKESA